jgi:hypothetical protein
VRTRERSFELGQKVVARERLFASTSFGRPARSFIVTTSSALATRIRTPSITRSSARSKKSSSGPGPARMRSTAMPERESLIGITRVRSANATGSDTRGKIPHAASAATTRADGRVAGIDRDVDVGGEPGGAV